MPVGTQKYCVALNLGGEEAGGDSEAVEELAAATARMRCLRRSTSMVVSPLARLRSVETRRAAEEACQFVSLGGFVRVCVSPEAMEMSSSASALSTGTVLPGTPKTSDLLAPLSSLVAM